MPSVAAMLARRHPAVVRAVEEAETDTDVDATTLVHTVLAVLACTELLRPETRAPATRGGGTRTALAWADGVDQRACAYPQAQPFFPPMGAAAVALVTKWPSVCVAGLTLNILLWRLLATVAHRTSRDLLTPRGAAWAWPTLALVAAWLRRRPVLCATRQPFGDGARTRPQRPLASAPGNEFWTAMAGLGNTAAHVRIHSDHTAFGDPARMMESQNGAKEPGAGKVEEDLVHIDEEEEEADGLVPALERRSAATDSEDDASGPSHEHDNNSNDEEEEEEEEEDDDEEEEQEDENSKQARTRAEGSAQAHVGAGAGQAKADAVVIPLRALLASLRTSLGSGAGTVIAEAALPELVWLAVLDVRTKAKHAGASPVVANDLLSPTATIHVSLSRTPARTATETAADTVRAALVLKLALDVPKLARAHSGRGRVADEPPPLAYDTAAQRFVVYAGTEPSVGGSDARPARPRRSGKDRTPTTAVPVCVNMIDSYTCAVPQGARD
jgi:hypothetical protein